MADGLLEKAGYLRRLREYDLGPPSVFADEVYIVGGTITVTPTAPVGTLGNAWSADVVAAAGLSQPADLGGATIATFYGTASAATTIIPQVSVDNVTYADLDPDFHAASQTNGNFGRSFPIGTRYLRLKSSGAATITATIAGKGS